MRPLTSRQGLPYFLRYSFLRSSISSPRADPAQLMQTDSLTLIIMPTRIAMPQPISGFVQIAGDNLRGTARRRQIADASERRGSGGTVNHLMQRGRARIDVKEPLPYRVDRPNRPAGFSRAARASGSIDDFT